MIKIVNSRQKTGERKGGFTLLETLVAVAILTLAVTGPFIAARNGYIAAHDAKNYLIASYLAQEGIEWIRALRDDTYLNAVQQGGTLPQIVNECEDADFSHQVFCYFVREPQLPNGYGSTIKACRDQNNDGVADGNDSNVNTACMFDPGASSGMGIGSDKFLQTCTDADSCLPLYYSSSGYTLNSSGTATGFTRKIQFYDVGIDLQVKVTVTWNYHGPHTIVLDEYLTPWE